MHSQMAELFTSAGVRVIWRDDVDPRGTAPLWAAVHRVATDPHQTLLNEAEQVVIEIGEAPSRRGGTSERRRKAG